MFGINDISVASTSAGPTVPESPRPIFSFELVHWNIVPTWVVVKEIVWETSETQKSKSEIGLTCPNGITSTWAVSWADSQGPDGSSVVRVKVIGPV